MRQPSGDAQFCKHGSLDLHHPAARRRADRIFQGQEQGVAHFIVSVRGLAGFDSDRYIQDVGVDDSGERAAGGAAGGVCPSTGQDEKVHAQRNAAGDDDSGSGVAESFQELNPHGGVKFLALAALDA